MGGVYEVARCWEVVVKATCCAMQFPRAASWLSLLHHCPMLFALLHLAGCGEAQTTIRTTAAITKYADERPERWFDDVTALSGVECTYRNGEEANRFALLESLGGGVAVLDYNRDGLLDLLFPGGGWFTNSTICGYPCKLYRNGGSFRFVDVTTESGFDKQEFYSHGAAVGDYDRDGWPDVVVTGWGRLRLFHNEANGEKGRHFVEVGLKAGFVEHMWSSSAAWADLDGDGWADLYVCQYADWSFASNHPTDCYYDPPLRDICPATRFMPLQHKLFRNQRDGTFVDVSDSERLRSDGKGLGVVITDVTADGRPDIYAVNDTDENFLYINHTRAGAMHLEECALLAGVARDNNGVANGSMGVDVADFDGSGLASLFCTNYENEFHALYQNRGAEHFRFYSQQAGIASIGTEWVSWGTGFADFCNHGWEDLIVVNGHVLRFPGGKSPRRQRPVLFRNDGGRFVESGRVCGTYFNETHNARGLALADLDNDGRIDVVVSHLNEPVTLLRNVVDSPNHWLGIELIGKDRRDIVGARVIVEVNGRRLSRFIKGGGSYASSSDRRLTFGLGPVNSLPRVEIVWPWGESQFVDGLGIDRYWRITEGSNHPRALCRDGNVEHIMLSKEAVPTGE